MEPRKDGFAQLVFVSNWGHWLEIDGQELRDGERLEIQFKDGTVISGTVRRQVFSSGGELNANYAVSTEIAHLQIERFGQTVLILLTKDLSARRV